MDRLVSSSAEIGPVVVTAMFELSDGSLHSGFVCAVKETWDVPPKPNIRGIRARYGGSDLALLGIQQPRIFVNQLRFRFWGGRRGIPLEERRAFYAAFGKTPEEILPVKFWADPMLVTGSLTGRLDGFYRLIGDQASQAERWGSTNPRSQLINPPISL